MLITLAGAHSVAEAIAMLRDALMRFNQARAADAHELGILRFEVCLDAGVVASSTFLRAANLQPHDRKLYWRAKGGAQALCLGVAYQSTENNGTRHNATLNLVPPLLKKHPYIRLYGGMRFDSSAESSKEWRPFGSFRFFLPSIEFFSEEGRATIACHLVAQQPFSTISDLLGDLEQVNIAAFCEDFTDSTSSARASSYQPSLTPGFDGWHGNIEKAVSHIAANDFEKVVLARKRLYALREFSPFSLLDRLTNVVNPAAYFCWQLDAETAFLGATPELLYAREGQSIRTEALAGTRKRGLGIEEDEALLRDLFDSDKEQREHELVAQQIADVLKRLCVDSGVRHERGVVKLSNVQHLESIFGGVLKTGLSDLDIIQALHPTASVCGLPSGEALRFIREHEGFDRGFYAGPFGMLSLDKAEFVVAIRSALMCACDLHVYGGAGIVRGSEPGSEWDEIEHKMKPFLEVIGETDAIR
jgi:menaquinone-specific isochorismate synthase